MLAAVCLLPALQALRVLFYSVGCLCAELVAPDNSHPSANVSSLPGPGQASNAGSSTRFEQLPHNGVLWNLDRIVCPGCLHTPVHPQSWLNGSMLTCSYDSVVTALPGVFR